MIWGIDLKIKKAKKLLIDIEDKLYTAEGKLGHVGNRKESYKYRNLVDALKNRVQQIRGGIRLNKDKIRKIKNKKQ